MKVEANGVWRWIAGLLGAALISGLATWAWAAGAERVSVRERLARIETLLEGLSKRLDEEVARHHK